MILLQLSLKPENWAASTGELTRRHPEGWNLDPEPIVLAEWAAGADVVDSLTEIITGLVTLGQASGWQAQSMLIREVGTVPVIDGGEQVRKVLELAVNLIARGDHPDPAVRGKTKPDTWSSESLPTEVRDAFLVCWEALQL